MLPAKIAILAIATFSFVPAALAQSAPAPIWEGWYVGIDGGGLNRSGKQALPATGLSGHSNSSGEQVGLFGGHNWQSGPWVYGIEADWTHGIMNGAAGDVDMFSARARSGWTFGNALIYATAGIATENRFLYVAKTNGVVTERFSDEQQHTGLIVGGGLEAMLSQSLSLRAEALYFDGSKEQYDFPASTTFAASSATSVFNQVNYRIGLTYHLN